MPVLLNSIVFIALSLAIPAAFAQSKQGVVVPVSFAPAPPAPARTTTIKRVSLAQTMPPPAAIHTIRVVYLGSDQSATMIASK
jgi:hypothetical protein